MKQFITGGIIEIDGLATLVKNLKWSKDKDANPGEEALIMFETLGDKDQFPFIVPNKGAIGDCLKTLWYSAVPPHKIKFTIQYGGS